LAKIAPPLRTKKDNEELWEGLKNGSVDFVATDHAPYEVESEKVKEGFNIWTAYPGIPGVETMVPIIVSEGYNKGRISLSKMVDILSTNAAKHYGLYPKKGAMHIGSDADFTIIDLDKVWTIDPKKQASLCGYTPLEGMQLKGKVSKTIIRGHLVYEDVDESALAELKDSEIQELVHEYPEDFKERFKELFKDYNNLYSKEYENSYRKQHPEVVYNHIRNIKGIKVKPGFGEFVKRHSIQVLPKTITY
ncbi:MAG: dihydroorotase, partial [Thermoanaerobacteraceae bacterium]